MTNTTPHNHSKPRFTVIRSTRPQVSVVLKNLLEDTSTPVLITLSERYGLPRMPGLNREALIERLIGRLSGQQLQELQRHLIAARFRGASVPTLLDTALESDAKRVERRIAGGGVVATDGNTVLSIPKGDPKDA